MSRLRVLLFVGLCVAVLGAALAFVLVERDRHDRRAAEPPTAATTTVAQVQPGPRIVFRHTGHDRRYGEVAMVAVADPSGPRAFTGVVCDRVAAWSSGASCLVTRRGVVTSHEAVELDASWRQVHSRPLPGVPSRTQVSPGGALVATTSFVTGHSYMTVGFSTATTVRETGGGRDWGNLEEFALELDGRRVRPVDRNVWGVTFVDERRFFATVATGGRTWLVAGDLARRTLTSVAEGAECPSLSPDGSQVAHKVDVAPGDDVVWGLAVLDLATGELTRLVQGPEGVDDQVAWLDEETLLFGLPRAEDPGVSDVWAVAADGSAPPRLLIEQAWSPTVVR